MSCRRPLLPAAVAAAALLVALHPAAAGAVARGTDSPPQPWMAVLAGKRSAGLASLLVEKERDSFPEGITGRPIDKIGYHGFVTWDLQFDGLRVPVANRIGEAGFADAQKWLNTARVHTAARAVGLARAAVEDCTVYLQERHQFEHPIGDFQAVRFALADMAARVEQARAFYQHVAHLIDLGLPCEREAAMVKLTATEMAAEVTGQGIQLHGGNGYTTEHQVERHWRDARLTTIFEGTSEIQRLIISRAISGMQIP